MSATTMNAVTAEGLRPRQTRWPAAVWAVLAITLMARSFGFVYPFLSYHLNSLGFSTQVIGRTLAVFGIGWLIGQLLIGWTADRLGKRRTLVTAMTVAACCLPILAQLHAVAAVCTGSLIAGIVYDAPRPVVSALIADLITDDAQRAAVNGWRHGAVNLGAATTGAAGAFLAERLGFQALFWLNSGACAACALIAHHYLDATPALSVASRPTRTRVLLHATMRDGRLWLVSAASISALTCVTSMFTALPMLMEDDGLPAGAYGWTQVANAATVVLLTPFLTPWLSCRCAAERPMIGMLAASTLLLGAGMGSAGLADTTTGYCLAVAAAVPGEIAFFIAASDVLNKISPDNNRGLYAGIWGSTLAIAVIIAPVLAATSLTAGGHRLVALTTLGAGALGAVLCIPLTRLSCRPATITPRGAQQPYRSNRGRAGARHHRRARTAQPDLTYTPRTPASRPDVPSILGRLS
ncbi:MFS transporter [Streptomyces sp. AHU1]|uniref:MFS transporter n=1 Tax=Streptomyces sp. AHU1 TaxID=3377215 RepID=UPI003877AD27